MAVFFKSQELHSGIHSIPADIRKDIMECVQNVKHSGTEDGIKAANSVEIFIKMYETHEAEDIAKDAIISNLTDADEEKLKEAHADDYHGTDDDMPDAYEKWQEDLTSVELKQILASQPSSPLPENAKGE